MIRPPARERKWRVRAALLGTLLAASSVLAAGEVDHARPVILTVDLRQPITVATQEYVEAALARARDQRADGLVVLLDTPGGSLESTRSIVQAFLASEVPIIVYVSPAGARAGSAGVFITLAANIAAMQPSANIGAAHPVTSSGGDVEAEAGKDMARKVENDTAAFARSIARTRGRNEDWAEKAVRESASVTAAEALKLHVIDVIEPSFDALLDDIDGRTVTTGAGAKVVLRTKGAAVTPVGMTLRQWLLSLLANPSVAAILMLIGTAGVGLEFYHPGSIYPGVIGGISLLLGLLATQVIPVNAGAILLLLAGMALLIVEAYVTTHGIAGLGGAVCIVVGLLLFVNRSSSDFQFEPSEFRVSPLIVWPLPISLALVMTYVAAQVQRTRRRPQLVGAAGLVGERGDVLSDVSESAGEIFVHGEHWQARASRPLAKGTRVRVVSVDGLVSRVEADEAAK